MRQIIKAAVAADGRSIYEIARTAGVAHQVISRYLTGERDMRSMTIDKVLAVLGKSVRLVNAKEARP